MEVLIRPVTPDLAATWEAMRRELWPGSEEHASEIAAFFAGSLTEPLAVFSAHDLSGAMIGFAELSIRLPVSNSSQPVMWKACMSSRLAAMQEWRGNS